MTGHHVVVTGGMGFIGSSLVEALLEAGSTVTVIDDLSTGRAQNVAHVRHHPGYRELVADVRDAASREVLEGQADLIVHLAAAVGVRQTFEHPVETIDTNVETTAAVLQAARRHRTKVVLASTSEVYGKTSKFPSAEDDDIVLGPTSHLRWAYAASKVVDELMALGCWKEFGVPVVICRLFNVAGARQSDHYVLPRFVRAALAGQPLEIYGDGSQTRCFTHVDDTVSALLALAACDAAVGQIFNIGAQHEMTIGELAHRVLAAVGVAPAEAAGRCTYLDYHDVYGDDFDDFARRMPDTSKLTAYTGWQPRHGLDRMIDDVIASHR